MATSVLLSYAVKDPDTRLMLRVKEDDTAAFEELIERYRNRVVMIAHHLLGNSEEAEDLAQEVFLRVFRSRKTYEPTAKFSTWLFTIVNNLALNAKRDRRRERQSQQMSASESGPLGPRPLEQLKPDQSGAMPSRIFARANSPRSFGKRSINSLTSNAWQSSSTNLKT